RRQSLVAGQLSEGIGPSSMIPLRPVVLLSRKESFSSEPVSSPVTRFASATLRVRKLLSALSMDSCIWRVGTIRPLGGQKICAASRNRFSKWHAGWYVREINDGDQWLQRFRHRECTRGIASCRRPLPSRLESSSRIDFFS